MALLREPVRRRWPLFAALAYAKTLPLVWTVLLYALRAFAPVISSIVLGFYAGVALDGQGFGPAGILLVLAALGTVVIVEHATTCFVNPHELRVARQIEGRIRAHLSESTLAADVATLERPQVQDRIALVLGRDGMLNIGRGALGQLWLLIRFAAALTGTAVMARYSPIAAVLLLACMLALRSILRRQWFGISDTLVDQEEAQRRAGYFGNLLARVDAAHEVRIFGVHHWFLDRFAAESWRNLDVLCQARAPILRQQPLVAGLTVVGVFIVLAALPGLNGTEPVTAQDAATFLQAAWAVLAIGSVGREAHHIEYGLPKLQAFRQLDAMLGTASERIEGVVTGGRRRPAPVIEFDDVWFGYRAGADVLRGVRLRIEPGERLAIVGTNGAGKSTLFKLMCGVYSPRQGMVLVDGRPLTPDWAAEWWSRVSMVTQRPNLFPLSLRENLVLGTASTWSDEELAGLLSVVGLASLPDRLPDGFDTALFADVRGGVPLSVGQRQRIAIARSLLLVREGASVLVLDEPTAHLDSSGERTIVDHVATALDGVTRVTVSHRLANLRSSDRIAVLHDGVITEIGDHDTLVRLGGRYARLFTTQASAFTTTAPTDEDDRA